jgi:hypothetical protein
MSVAIGELFEDGVEFGQHGWEEGGERGLLLKGKEFPFM